jgi:DNA-directed RNA polymerase subunit RPC12/RpoP
VIRFKCPHCGKAIEVEDADAGKEGDCHGCGKRIRVPRPVIVSDSETGKILDMPGNGPETKRPGKDDR